MIERQALTVTQVNLYIKQVIARDDILNNVLVLKVSFQTL